MAAFAMPVIVSPSIEAAHLMFMGNGELSRAVKLISLPSI
jgi:hypothetical protein